MRRWWRLGGVDSEKLPAALRPSIGRSAGSGPILKAPAPLERLDECQPWALTSALTLDTLLCPIYAERLAAAVQLLGRSGIAGDDLRFESVGFHYQEGDMAEKRLYRKEYEHAFEADSSAAAFDLFPNLDGTGPVEAFAKHEDGRHWVYAAIAFPFPVDYEELFAATGYKPIG